MFRIQGEHTMKQQQKMLPFLFVILIIGIAYSQNFKYPMNIKYHYGFLPKTITSANLDKWYNSYKSSNLLPECNGGIRTAADNASETKVESMGWAMIIAAYMGDKSTFDGLYKFYKSKVQGHGMMAWRTTCGGISDGGSASDGDLDVAFSMVVASWQWGESYKTEAVKIINTVKKLIVNCSGTSVISGGMGGSSTYGGCQETDISYHTPAFFRCFADITDDKAWSKLADDTYTLLNNGADETTGLIPDWQTLSGAAAGGRIHSYGFDACRAPWRIALDYLWNGNEKAKEWCTKISSWAYKIGPQNIKDGYNLNGTATGRNHNMAYVGSFAVAAMCNSQEIADAFGTEIARMSFHRYWYHAFLGNCYMLAMTGNMWHAKDTGMSTRNVEKRKLTLGNNDSVVVRTLKDHVIEISGIPEGNYISLVTLNGHIVERMTVIDNRMISIDVSLLKSGCYILAIHKKNDKNCFRQMVSIY
jgi:endo-1,4-beta-D-glucanase Y